MEEGAHDLEKLGCLGDGALVQSPQRPQEGRPVLIVRMCESQTMARIATRDCESAVPNRYELVLLAAELARELPGPLLLAREQDRRGDAKTVAPLRHIAERAADPEVLRINRWRRTKDMPLLGDSNDDRPPAVGGAQAA
jgi:DNA-directed RNA polymerase subunit K/omega